MAEERNCGQCGKGLSADAPGGLCPECLLKVGLQSQSQEPVGQSGEGALPTASYGKDVDAAAKEETLTLAAGQQFGGYHIVGRLGSGGMGTVYEADQIETGRRVALKVLGHRFDSPEAKQRFLREGRLAASVNHPNSDYAFGTEEISGVPVIAMELVPGGTLEERVLRGGPMPIGRPYNRTFDEPTPDLLPLSVGSAQRLSVPPTSYLWVFGAESGIPGRSLRATASIR